MGASDFYTFGAGANIQEALSAAIDQAGHEDGYSYSGTISMKAGNGFVIMKGDPVPADVASKVANRIMQREYDALERDDDRYALETSRFTAKDGPVGAIAVGPAKAYKQRKRVFTLSGDGNPWQEAIKRFGDGVSRVEVLEDDHKKKVVKTTGPDPRRTKGYEVCDGHGHVLIYGIASVAVATREAEELLKRIDHHTELHVRRASGVIRFVEEKTKSRRRRVEVTVITGSTDRIAGWLFFGTAAS